MAKNRFVARLYIVVVASFVLSAACSGNGGGVLTNPTNVTVPGSNLDYGMVTFTYYRDVACTRLCDMKPSLGDVWGTWPQAYDFTALNHGKAPEMTLQELKPDGTSLWTITIKTPSKDGLCVIVGDPNQEAYGGETSRNLTAITPNGVPSSLKGGIGVGACFNYAPPDKLTPQS